MIPITGRKLRGLRSRLYSGFVRQAIRELGLNKVLSGPYWKTVYALSENVQTHKIHGHKVDFQTNTFAEFMRFRDLTGERPIIEHLLSSLGPEDVFYDIGANVGTYTCFTASKIGPDQVVAFEPEPTNVNRLQENLKLNDLGATVVPIALSDTNGTIDLTLTGDEHAIATDTDANTITVETARGDTVIEQQDLQRPTVLKIDVEGAELPVLQGLESTLEEYCRYVYCEVHPAKLPDFDQTASDVESFLENLGFQVQEINRRGDEVVIFGES